MVGRLLTILVLLELSGIAPLELAGSYIDDGPLFRIERSRDADEVWYVLNRNDMGQADKEQPLKVFWMKKTEGNKREELTKIQRRFSYGILSMDADPVAAETWNFRLAADRERVFTLKKDADEQFRVYAELEGKEAVVQSMFVQFDGGTFLAPKIAFIRLCGTDCQNGMEISETVRSK